jgi:hypothetical protein
MKFTKLSIAALAVVGFASSAMAMDLSGVTAKPFAGVKLYYEATDKNDYDLFDQASASGQALVNAGVTGKFDSCWGYGFEYMVADTLGLENNLVGDVRMGAGTDADALDTHDWASQAYVTYSPCDTILSNTTFKIGRQYLDTPLAFTERWNLAPNSFDAIVALNQDIQNVTLVGAYVGRGNGVKVRVSNADKFEGYGTNVARPNGGKGAYAVGALTNFVEGLPINLWYYNVVGTADAFWADADYTYKMAEDMSFDIGAQYGSIMPKGVLDGVGDTNGYGVKIGTKVGMFDVMAAYSSVDDDNGNAAVALANTATMSASAGGKKTKLYTAGIYTDGTGVAVPGSDAYKIKASANVAGVGKFIAQYVVCENDNNNPMQNVSELDVIYATKLAGINTKLIYMNRSIDEGKVANAGLKDDTQHFRVILSKNF